MSETIITVIVACIASFPGILSLFLNYRREKKTLEHDRVHHGSMENADTGIKLSDAALHLLEPYKNEADKLRQQVNELSEQMRTMRSRLMDLEILLEKVVTGSWDLHNQVKELGHTPKYTPPERRYEVIPKSDTGLQ